MRDNRRPGRYVLAGTAIVAIGSIAWRAASDDRPATPALPPAAAAPQGAPSNTPDVAQMVSRLEARLRARPDDAAGWRMLGWSYFNMERFADSARAYRRTTDLAPDRAENWSALGEALVLGGKGVGEDAAAAFRRALAIDPKDARARYFLAVRQDLAGDHRGAVAAWIALLKDTPAGAPWEQSVRTLVEQVAAREKIDIAGRLPAAAPAMLPAPSMAGNAATDAIPGPTADQLASAATLTPSQQDAMARGMVDKLAARLAADPRDADGWLRLMRARMVLNDPAGAARALATARATFEGDPSTLARIDAAAQALSIGVR